ncbi:tetratricopeptide repeat protein [Sphingomonas quercus]|uniref:Tetratricopeptide repeat protein n=1 Tax=Sphingomonas quercus TaxID=2842451 RepID=A0ABS6BIA6_9SPHN|nr:tetratricopeptide repeat protein [Sphingomonas quercus]MBU3077181.1 tetratricopeptide repeat protein [Sphingomonas quercus]
MRGIFAAAATLALLAGCSSRADRASKAAIAAESYMQQGNLRAAIDSARKATSERDDISDYWLLLGRIAVTAGDATGAYTAYQRAVELDPNNGEALMTLGRLGMSLGRADDVDRYADRILLADPSNRGARVMKAASALQHGDKAMARRYIDDLLAANAQDMDAMILKARLLASSNDAAGAAKLIEETLDTVQQDPGGRLTFLRTLYAGTGERANLMRTLRRLSFLEKPDPADLLAYAGMLYEDGDTGAADETVARAMKQAPNSLDLAADILELWRDAGPAVPPAASLAAVVPDLSLEMRAVKAQRANDLGRPDVALAILGPDVAKAATTSANADARAAYAAALALRGATGQAGAMLDEILARDPGQPRALLARARLAAARRDFRAAVADGRRVVADDARNATARILLAGWLRGLGEEDLALSQLREGARAAPDNVRMAESLVKALIERGDKAGATDALENLARAARNSTGAARLQARMCGEIGDAGCLARMRRAATEGSASMV